jgi:hypothetical protein
MVGLLVAGGVVALIVATVAYLQLRGVDPGPMLELVTQLVGAVSAFSVLLLQLATRRTQTKVERNTGVIVPERIDELSRNTKDLADATWEILHELPPRVQSPQPEAYPLTRPAPHAGHGAAPPEGR